MSEPRTADPPARRPTPDMLIDVDRLRRAYYDEHPDPRDARQGVSFGTSGHRGTSFEKTFTEDHIVAISEAIAGYRAGHGITGPLFIGRDTHALSEPAFRTAVEVLVAHGVRVAVDADDGYTPTPAISHAILTFNAHAENGQQADGIVITPSHNPPADGGFKYNPPHGGPADTDVTGRIQDAANERLRSGAGAVKRLDYEEANARADRHDFRTAYVDALEQVVDLELIAGADIRLGVDPLGGASVAYWQAIVDRYGLPLEVVNDRVDPRFAFMPLDHDGKIRMDCSSPDAMADLIALKDRFDVAFANDPDADRHGIVTPAGLMNPNHYLAVAISYLLGDARQFDAAAGVGKTMVSSSIIDRVVEGVGHPLREVPVGFKWFVSGLLDGTLAFGGEESAGASFLRRDGRPWSTDKDGLIMCLLAAEMTVRDGRDPAERYAQLTERYGAPVYRRVDAPATSEQKRVLGGLSPDDVSASQLAGDPIAEVLTEAPSGGALGGVKVVTRSGWFAARPSGTEDVYKLYAESFEGSAHLERILEEAQELVDATLHA